MFTAIPLKHVVYCSPFQYPMCSWLLELNTAKSPDRLLLNESGLRCCLQALNSVMSIRTRKPSAWMGAPRQGWVFQWLVAAFILVHIREMLPCCYTTTPHNLSNKPKHYSSTSLLLLLCQFFDECMICQPPVAVECMVVGGHMQTHETGCSGQNMQGMAGCAHTAWIAA